VKLWIAEGFGVGRLPFAPGTFGSVLGVFWFWVLLLPGNTWVFVAGTMAALGASVWLCGAAEKTLGQKDPGSVILDEIAAMPVCFSGWTAIVGLGRGAFPRGDYFFSSGNWLSIAGIVVAFRFFDILKPWPVRQSQSLPGGWGVTVDDALAALYVNGVVLAVYAVRMFLLKAMATG